MTAILPIIAAPALASTPPAADPALDAYQDVMARQDETEAVSDNSQWHLVEAWCAQERAALTALAERFPPGIEPLLHRLIIMAERVEEVGHNAFQSEEMDVFRAMGKRAAKMLEGGA